MESACDDINLECYIQRLRLLDFFMAEEFTVSDVTLLRTLVLQHHTLFQQLYPGNDVPKFHYEAHIPTQILLYGSPRQQWCFRFEAKHAFFKHLLRITRSLKNQSYTLSMRHQTWQAGLMLLSAKGESGPFLSNAAHCGIS
ncbi:Peptide chain release factor 1 [Frankliniella fusca]|uniref:Peptide chain release factor 1 n=1 Tax=Frankliniella fusca TaxID=407009 RepID=A0AAE1GWY6_9NEOP|nr:Peptide chain release factor 1 [Frankliniella fusca]